MHSRADGGAVRPQLRARLAGRLPRARGGRGGSRLRARPRNVDDRAGRAGLRRRRVHGCAEGPVRAPALPVRGPRPRNAALS